VIDPFCICISGMVAWRFGLRGPAVWFSTEYVRTLEIRDAYKLFENLILELRIHNWAFCNKDFTAERYICAGDLFLSGENRSYPVPYTIPA